MLRIGTSGWHYAHWREVFYPRELAPSGWLGWYARHFDCVEVNNAFYRLPSQGTVRQWAESVPEGFSFAVKASRYITHVRRLNDCAQAVQRFLDRMHGLGPHQGPVLFQLPGRWRPDLSRLQSFLDGLPPALDAAFEFRDLRWHTRDVADLLAAHGVAFCVYDADGERSPLWLTAPFAYVRMHGPLRWYAGEYRRAGLGWLAEWLTELRRAGKGAWVFFNNDAEGRAVRDALALKELVGGIGREDRFTPAGEAAVPGDGRGSPGG